MRALRPLLFLLGLCLCSGTASAQFVAQDARLQFVDPIPNLPALENALAQPNADQSLHSRLQRAMDSVYALTSSDGRYGITASVIVSGLPQWSGTAGISNPGEPISPEHLVEVASNTKTFVTAAILQLEEEGSLTLNDPISLHLPDFNFVDPTITIKQLLDHSSGVYDYMNDDPDGTLIVDAYLMNPSKRWTPQEVLASIGQPNFNRGTSFRYSNTGFTLLGLIVESVTKEPVAKVLRSRFFDPLQLTNTFAGSDESISGEFTHQWIPRYQSSPAQDLFSIDKTGHLSLAWAAGYIVSTPSDLARWSHQLYRGKLLTSVTMTKMLKMNSWSDGVRYGLGTSQVPYGAKRLYGHTGSLPGFQSMMFTNPKDSVTIVVVSNSGGLPGDISPNDYVIALLGEVYRPVAGSVGSEDLARVYQIEGGRTLKAEFSEAERLATDVSLVDLLGRTYTPRLTTVANGLRVELDDLPIGVYAYRFATDRLQYTGKISLTR